MTHGAPERRDPGPRVDRDAWTVGMTLVPGLLSRNRSFALFEEPEMRRARVRVALLRGIVRHLAGGQGRVEGLEVLTGIGVRELRYRLPGLKVDRRAVLSDTEYACVAFLAVRSGAPGLAATDEDRARIDAALRRLTSGVKLADAADRSDPGHPV